MQSIRQDVSFALMKFVAQQLLPIVSAVPANTLQPLLVPVAPAEAMNLDGQPDHPSGVPADHVGPHLPPDLAQLSISPLDMDEWRCEPPTPPEITEFRLGPVRVRCRLASDHVYVPA